MYSLLFDGLVHSTTDGSWFDIQIDASERRLLSVINQTQTSKAVIAGLPLEGNNSYILNMARERPDTLVPVAAVNPLFGDSQKQVRVCLSQLQADGFRGIKLYPQLDRFHPNDSRVYRVIKIAAELKLPVMLCTIFRPPAPPLKRPVFDSLHELCLNTQNATLILVHGGYWDVLAVSEIIRPFENVFLDLSCTLTRFAQTSLIRDIEFIIRNLDRKTVVGSDFPESTMAEVMDIIKTFQPEIPPEKLENVLWNNLNRIFPIKNKIPSFDTK